MSDKKPVSKSSITKASVIGGKLKFKGSKKKSKKSKSKVSESYQESNTSIVSSTLTKTQENLIRAQLENEKIASSKPQKTYREKVNEFNEKLSTLTEHNDIPRISAAGNG